MVTRSGSTNGTFNFWAFFFAICVSFSDRPGIGLTFDFFSECAVLSFNAPDVSLEFRLSLFASMGIFFRIGTVVR